MTHLLCTIMPSWFILDCQLYKNDALHTIQTFGNKDEDIADYELFISEIAIHEKYWDKGDK